MSALLEVEGLTVSFGGVAAVDHVSLDVSEGELVALIGPNGAGKTTFIDAVTGFVKARGTVRFAGRSLGGMPPHRRARAGLARTFQSLELFEDLSVVENLLITAEHPRWSSVVRDLVLPRTPAGARHHVDRVLDLLELGHVADSPVTELSLGERKLVTVARALAARPRMVLLDEPAAGLDSHESGVLGARLRRVVRGGTTIVLVDHDMGLVMGVCDLVHVLEFGRLIASGPPRAIQDDPRVIRAYLGEAAAEVEAGA
jgi:branched-chain amino acid transport system ATP-binding protein